MSIRKFASAAIIAGLSAISGSGPLSAQDMLGLRGEVHIAGKTPVDPPPNEPRRTHAYLTVTGPAALAMYRNMRAKEEEDVCVTGNRLKRAGNLSCSVTGNGRNATCDFSVNLVQGSLEDGRAC